VLDESDFYERANAKIYRAVLDVFEFDGEVDLLTVNKYLRDRGELDECGGVQYIAKLASEVATSRNALHHAKQVLDESLKRQVIESATAAIEQAYKSTKSGAALSEDIGGKMLEVSSKGNERKFGSLRDVMDDVSTELKRATEQQRSVAGVDCGFWSINSYLNGFCKSELTIMAARPSIGKSTLARQIAVNASVKEKTGVVIFSVEMSKRQIGQCLACAKAGVSLQRLRRGRLSPIERERFADAMRSLESLPIYVDDTPSLTIPQARSAMQRMSQEHEIGLYIFDYLQLMTGEGRTTNDAVGYISKNLKSLSRTFDVPVVALSQLSRQVETRHDKRPQMADLRDSGGLEQDADNLILIHRPAFYESLVRQQRARLTPDKLAIFMRRVELIFPKTRFGGTGSQKIEWDTDTASFANPQGDAPLDDLDDEELEVLDAAADQEELDF
jgi:replicative DNA helicase